MIEADEAPLRPADLAELLLASGDLLPRQRARDQQSDLAGMELKRRLLNSLIHLDPEPEALDAALEMIIAEIGPPTGPTRSIAISFKDDWTSACLSPEFIGWLLDQAMIESNGQRERKRRRARTDQPLPTPPSSPSGG